MQKPSLSEDEIKRAVLPFLRHFYRYRYAWRPGTDRTQLDARAGAAGKIIADGMLAFEKENGQPFVCTIEATAKDNRQEVDFELNRPYFLWECAMMGSLSAAAAFVFLWRTKGRWLYELGWQGMAGLFLAIGFAGFWASYFLLRNRSKFRYIYAIEQFKSYHADEQWVALADGAFEDPNDERFLELKKQLIENGFGLMLVDAQGGVRPVITPSRLGAFGSKRRFYAFLTETDFFERYIEALPRALPKKSKELAGKSGKWLYERLKMGRAVEPTQRFMRSYFYQKAIFGFGLLIVAIIGWRSKGFRSIELFSDKEAIAQRDTFETRAEDIEYLEGDDVFFAQTPRPYLDLPVSESADEAASDSSDLVENLRKIAGNRAVLSNKTTLSSRFASKKETAQPSKLVSSSDPCDRFRGRSGWLIQDNFFESRANAEARVRRLRAQGMTSAMAPRACFGDERTGWAVFLGGIFESESSARDQLSKLQKAEAGRGLLIEKLILKKL